MNLSAHLSSLYAKKTQIENEIQYELKRPLPNFLKLSELKKQKLIMKQMIAELAVSEKPATA